jgi:radical SAM superfamily enzyme YgiQ (UPF0313 family)
MEEFENFLMPQALLYLGTILKENDIKVEVLDCCAEKVGWKSLRKVIERKRPDIICAGSETCNVHEDGKLFKITKEIDPEIITIAGGVHHSNMVEDSLNRFMIDFIVRWEGEYTLLELVKELAKPKSQQNLKKIKGIAYKEKDGRIIKTPPRPLIQNLDELPFPAYELMPLRKYLKFRRFQPSQITIHHSRGCIWKCDFCSCWPQMGEHKLYGNKVVSFPRWRTKSVERTIEEIEYLASKFKFPIVFHFTDDTWNLDPKWNKEFAEEIIKRRLDVHWYAYMRADCIVRDEKLGIFKKLVDAGLSQALIGVERVSTRDLEYLNTKGKEKDITLQAFKILHKYPSVIRVATFLVGLPNETKHSMLNQLNYALKLDAHLTLFQFFTPFPGTHLWKTAKERNLIATYDFRKYDFVSEPIMRTKYLTRDEIIKLRNYITAKYYLKRIVKNLKNLQVLPNIDEVTLKSLIFRYFMRKSSPFKLIFNYFNPLHMRALFPKVFYTEEEGILRRKPSWYDK